MKIPPTPTNQDVVRRLIYTIACDIGEVQYRYRGRTVDATVHDPKKEPVWTDITLSVSDQRSETEKHSSTEWILPALTHLERRILKQRALSDLRERWTRMNRRQPHPDQLALPL